MPAWSERVGPASAGAMISSTLATARRTSRPPNAAAAVAQVDGLARAGRGAGRRDRAAGRAALERRPRPRRSGARANPRPAGRARARCRLAATACLPRLSDREPAGPGVADGRNAARRIAIRGNAVSRTRSRVALFGEVLDRRLAVDAGEKQGRQKPRGARLQLGPRLPVDAGKVGRCQRIESVKEGWCGRPVPQAFQQEVVEAEGEVESRIAVPGAFGVEEDRAVGARQECSSARRRREPAPSWSPASRAKAPSGDRADRRVPGRGRLEVGLEADRVEDVVGRRSAAAMAGSPAVAAWIAAMRRPTSAANADIDMAVAQLRLPDRVARRIEIAHREEAALPASWPRMRGTASGTMRPAVSHPGDLVAVALDRRPPIRRDLQLRQRALDREDRARFVSTLRMSEDTPPVSGSMRGCSVPTRPSRRKAQMRS